MTDNGISDVNLIAGIKSKDEESMGIILHRYHRIIWKIVHNLCRFTPIGFDKEDLYQEGILGLLDAIDTYQVNNECKFSSFASVCIERRVRSFLRRTRSHSYKLLSDAHSLDAPLMVSEEELYLEDVVSIDIKDFNPEHTVMVSWATEQMEKIQDGLPEWQWQIYHMHLLGYSYKEISSELDIPEKEVDNTLQKIRRKIHCLFDSENA